MDYNFCSPISKGTLLIASPDMESGLYFRSVVLVCEHNQSGSFGLILNKPLKIELPQEIININEPSNPRLSTCLGGPIQSGQMMLLHSSDTIPDQTLKICPNLSLGGNLTFLQASLQNPEGPYIKICFGYSAWATGQLKEEVLDGKWFLHPVRSKHLFTIPPEKLWRSILFEMGEKYALLSMIPDDFNPN